MSNPRPAIPNAVGAIPHLDVDALRRAIQVEYAVVAADPGRGFHFHTGRPLASILGYEETWLDGIPDHSVASFAGTGNPFSLGALRPGVWRIKLRLRLQTKRVTSHKSKKILRKASIKLNSII